jgi:hypothetical protein
LWLARNIARGGRKFDGGLALSADVFVDTEATRLGFEHDWNPIAYRERQTITPAG